jgi:formate hydrogenlyase subunit 3/multisubunit Na+/H+ antiporter MnhD subunit
MPAPLIFVGVPILLAPIAYLLHRGRGVAGLTSAIIMAGLAALAILMPFNQPVSWLAGLTIPDSFIVIGRTFLIEPADRLALAFMFAQAALLFLVSGLGEPPPGLFGAGLGVLGLLSAALFVRPFLFAAIFIQLAAALSVVMLAARAEDSPSRLSSGRGALRFVVYLTLGMPFILLTGWLVEAASASPGDTAFTAQATTLLLFGFAILLGVVPFHTWLPAVAEQSSSFAAAFVFSVIRQGIIFLLLAFLDSFPWLNQNPIIYRALTLAGGGMALVGGLFAFGQRSLGRVLGYVMVVEIGADMLCLGLGSLAGVQAAVAGLATRGLALPLWAAGLDHLRRHQGGDTLAALHGAARKHPIPAAALVIGLLSLAGFPLTAGFTTRWPLLFLLAQIHPTAAIFLIVGALSISLVAARALAALLSTDSPPVPPSEVGVEPEELSPVAIGVYGLGFAVVFVVGLFPQWLLPLVANAASAFARYTR